MSFGTAEQAIRDLLTANWPRPTVPVLWENENRTIPDPPFVVVRISALDERLAAYGSGAGGHEWEVRGLISAEVHVHLLSGLALLRAIRDDFASVFRGKRFSGVTCYGVTPFGAPKKADKATVFVATAEVDFTYRYRG